MEPPQHLRAVARPTEAPATHETRGRPEQIRARISELTAHRHSASFQTSEATMARSMGASMARGLGILLIMMTLSEIAATRARRRSG